MEWLAQNWIWLVVLSAGLVALGFLLSLGLPHLLAPLLPKGSIL